MAAAASSLTSHSLKTKQRDRAWPEAARLRELALALQNIFAQQERRNALCDEFLDLCSMHGESHPGEPRLARLFLARIERGAGRHADGEAEKAMVVLHAFLALLSGFATMAALVAVITVLLQKFTPGWVGETTKPKPGYIFVNLGYSFLAAAAGGYVTAWIAQQQSALPCSRPGHHSPAACWRSALCNSAASSPSGTCSRWWPSRR